MTDTQPQRPPGGEQTHTHRHAQPNRRHKLSPGASRIGRWGAGVALALALALAAAEWAGWPFLREPVATQLSHVAAVPVTIQAPFRIRLLGTPRLQAGQLTVAAAAGTAAPFLLDATGVEVAIRWGDLWRAARGQGVRVQSLSAESMSGHLLRNGDGQASWQIGARPGAEPQTAAPRPVVERLLVKQANLVVDDQPLQLRLAVDVAEVSDACKARDPPPGPAAAPSSASASASAATAVTATAPCLRITATGQYRRADVRAQFDVADPLQLFAPHRPPQGMARVAGQATVGRAMLKFAGGLAGLTEAAALTGDITATGPSLGLVMAPLGVNLPQTPPFVLHGVIGLDGAVWQLAADRMDIGTSRLAGRFAFDTQRQPVYLSGQLTGKLLALQDLGPSVGAPGPAASAARAAKGRVLPDKRLDIPSLNAMNADVDVAIDSFGFGTSAVASLSALRVTLSLHEGLLKLDKLSAQVAGGSVRGSSSLQAKGPLAQWQAALQFDGIALQQWLRALQAQAAPVPYASGTLHARVALTGQGRSVAEVLGGADGQLQASLAGATLSHLVTEAAGLDVAQALGVLIRGDRSLPLRCARVQARVTQGMVNPVQGLVDNNDSLLRMDGQINLRNEALDLRLVVQPKDFSPLSLRSPVHVRGNLSQPRLSVEAGPVAARVMGALALGAVAPLLAWIPLLETGEAKAVDECATVPRAEAIHPAGAKPAGKKKP